MNQFDIRVSARRITVFQNQVPNSKGRAVIHSDERPPESQTNYRPSHRPITARVTLADQFKLLL
jgi:hypothetical protein